MASFIIRRLIASIFVLFAATFLMYILTSLSGDPLEDLRQSSAPNKAAAHRSSHQAPQPRRPAPAALLPLARRRCFRGDFGVSVQNQPVNVLLANAITSTLTLVTTATVVAIILGLIVGIISALRQYSGFDYSVTLLAFLFFSLPIFWVAVLLKQYGAIRLNDWLADPDDLRPVIIGDIPGRRASSGCRCSAAMAKRRLIVFGVAAVATGAVLTYLSATQWFADPSIGIVRLSARLAIGIAFGVTAISTGLRNRRALYASLIVALHRHRAVLPDDELHPQRDDAAGSSSLLAVLAVVVSGADRLASWAAPTAARGAHDGDRRRPRRRRSSRWTSTCRTGRSTSNSSRVRGRPIATVGSSTPGPRRQLLGSGHRPVHPPAAADDRDHPDLVRELHALLAREPARGHEPGLHPHRAREGPDRSARSSCATRSATR